MARKQNKPYVSAFELFNKSSKLVQNNLVPFLVLYLLPAVFSLHKYNPDFSKNHDAWLAGGFRPLENMPFVVGVGAITAGLILFVAFFILGLIVQAMRYRLELETANGKRPGFKHLFEAVKNYWLRLFGLAFVVGLLIIFGLILFIVPGLIMLRRYFLAPYVMVDKDVSISESMRRSAELTKPHSGAIWGIIGVFILLSLPNIIPVIGGLLAAWLTMLYSVAPALRYKELKALGTS